LKKQGKGFTGGELEKATIDSLRGLQAIHQNGDVHGNIKPIFIGINKNNIDYLLLKDLN